MRRLAFAAFAAFATITAQAHDLQRPYRAIGYGYMAVQDWTTPPIAPPRGTILLALPAEAPFYAGHTYYRRPSYTYPSQVRFPAYEPIPTVLPGYELSQVSPFPGGTCTVTSMWTCPLAQEANIGLPCSCRTSFGLVTGTVTGP